MVPLIIVVSLLLGFMKAIVDFDMSENEGRDWLFLT